MIFGERERELVLCVVDLIDCWNVSVYFDIPCDHRSSGKCDNNTNSSVNLQSAGLHR